MGLDVAEGFEFVIRFFDGQGRDDELLAQFPVGGQFVTGFEPSARDGFHNLPHDLAVDGKLVGRIDDQLHRK